MLDSLVRVSRRVDWIQCYVNIFDRGGTVRALVLTQIKQHRLPVQFYLNKKKPTTRSPPVETGPPRFEVYTSIYETGQYY